MKNNIDFDDITKELAEILKQKNKAYGNSFDKTMDKWGMTPLGIRLDDKIGRIDYMLQGGILSENGESLLDNWVKIHIMDYVSSDFSRPKSKEEETHGSITEDR